MATWTRPDIVTPCAVGPSAFPHLIPLFPLPHPLPHPLPRTIQAAVNSPLQDGLGILEVFASYKMVVRTMIFRMEFYRQSVTAAANYRDGKVTNDVISPRV